MSTVIQDEQARQHIAQNLSRILSERGLRQTQLAEMTGDTEMTISRTCRGICTPGVGVVARIAEALDVSMDRLAGPPPEKIPNSA
jgi:transcriptional regulator with XRE-family HTH domain